MMKKSTAIGTAIVLLFCSALGLILAAVFMADTTTPVKFGTAGAIFAWLALVGVFALILEETKE